MSKGPILETEKRFIFYFVLARSASSTALNKVHENSESTFLTFKNELMFIHLCLFSMPCSGTVRGRVGADLPGGGSLDAPGRSLSHGIHHGHDERRLPNLHRGVRDPGREGPPRVRIPTLRHSGSPWGLRRW